MIYKITIYEIEIAIANYFGIRENIIVPNISWGIKIHECDLLIIRKPGCGVEVEIKISKSDLKADFKKKHNHIDPYNRIKEFYFAIPDYLEDCLPLIPEHAGVISVSRNIIAGTIHTECRMIRKCKINTKAVKFCDNEIIKIAHLGTMRFWNSRINYNELKRKVNGFQQLLEM